MYFVPFRYHSMEQVFDRCLIVRSSKPGIPEAVIPVSGASTVREVKGEVEMATGIPKGEQRLLFRGRILKDDDTIGAIGAEDMSIFYLHHHQQPRTLSSDNAPPLPSMRNPSRGHLEVRATEPMVIFKMLAKANPDLLLQVFQSDPKLKRLMERNPQIRHLLSDPATIQQLLRAGGDPRLQSEMMRGHEQALANLENMPGGFQALQQFYQSELGDNEELLSDSVGTSLEIVPPPRRGRNTEALPNPWAQNQTPELQNVPIRSRRHSADGIVNAFEDTYHSGLPSPSDAPNGPPEQQPFDVKVYEARYRHELDMMSEMGFTDMTANIRALLATGGNVDLAIERLLLINPTEREEN